MVRIQAGVTRTGRPWPATPSRHAPFPFTHVIHTAPSPPTQNTSS